MINVLKLMFPYLRPFWKEAVFATILAFPLAAIKAYEAFLVRDIFDKGFAAGSTSDDAWKLAALLVGLGILNFPLRYFLKPSKTPWKSYVNQLQLSLC